jgi:LacI family transcriptional regulator
MSDVASLAGVATMTVSRVINGNEHVAEATRQRVHKAIERLKYRPNTVARSLREQRSRQIGIIVPNIDDPFFGVCAQAVSVVAKEHGYSVNIAISAEDPTSEFREAIRMLQHNIEGLVVIPAAEGVTRLTEAEFARLPIVAIDRPIRLGRVDSVVVENTVGAELAVQHLRKHGHRRIAFIGHPLHLYTMKMRHNGYCMSMQRSHALPESYCGRFNQSEILALLHKITSRKMPVTAIVSANGPTTRGILHGLATLRIKVPETIAIVGFDDFETADIINPAMTVVSQPLVDMGTQGANLLFSRLLSEKPSSRRTHKTLPIELVIRKSCGC